MVHYTTLLELFSPYPTIRILPFQRLYYAPQVTPCSSYFASHTVLIILCFSIFASRALLLALCFPRFASPALPLVLCFWKLVTH